MTDNTEPQLVNDNLYQPDLTSEQTATQFENNDHLLTLDQLSLEAVINVLVQRGICTEAELFTEEKRLRSVRRTMAGLAFVPVQTKHADHAHHKDHSALRHWASQYRWSRRVGTALFGWKWRRVKNDPV